MAGSPTPNIPVLQNSGQARQITRLSGDLFHIAAEFLGDATQWNIIAALNGRRDPFFVGQTVITLPPVNPSAGNGGLLGV